MINGANMKRTTTTQAIVIFAVLLSSTKIIVGSQIITYSELFVSKKKDFNKKVTTDNRRRGTKIAWSDSEDGSVSRYSYPEAQKETRKPTINFHKSDFSFCGGLTVARCKNRIRRKVLAQKTKKIKFVVVPDGNMVTLDYNPNRCRLFYIIDSQGKRIVKSIPYFG